MAKIHFHLNETIVNALTWEEYEALERAEDGELKLYQIRPVLARFLANEDNSPVEHKIAMKQLAAIPVQQIPEIIKQFMDDLRRAAIPKASGDSSSPPSDPKPESASESHAG